MLLEEEDEEDEEVEKEDEDAYRPLESDGFTIVALEVSRLLLWSDANLFLTEWLLRDGLNPYEDSELSESSFFVYKDSLDFELYLDLLLSLLNPLLNLALRDSVLLLVGL